MCLVRKIYFSIDSPCVGNLIISSYVNNRLLNDFVVNNNVSDER